MAVSASRGGRQSWLVHLAVALLVIAWVTPTAGLFVSSLRDKDQLAVSGWWTALFSSSQNKIHRSVGPESQTEIDGLFILEGNIFEESGESGQITAFGWRSQEPSVAEPGSVEQMRNGQSLTVNEDGDYRLTSPEEWSGKRGKRIFYTSLSPPRFTLENYQEVLGAEGIGRSFINTLTVTIPATIIPIMIAAFAAYALAWMRFPGRLLLIGTMVGLLVVPLQMSLIPLLTMYNGIAQLLGVPTKTYVGIWLAHTGFGLPLAIFLLHGYMRGLPKEVMESARVDGATDFGIFTKIVLPLSFPALASFAILQFLWVWNDLLVAMVFLGVNEEQLVLTGRLREMLGSRGGNWEILTASAFVTIVVPLIVFFSLQRYLVRGLLAGSVKGG